MYQTYALLQREKSDTSTDSHLTTVLVREANILFNKLSTIIFSR